ncbi:GTPase Era [bacterium]|nr:GTPase Era [bacterium]
MMKAGFAGILGVTNAGKSTIINNILGEELSIATPVVQTTRDLIKGIHNDDDYQIVFIDTPGYHKHGKLFEKCLLAQIDQVINDENDVNLWIIDIKNLLDENESVIEFRDLISKLSNVLIVINKIDLVEHSELDSALKYAEKIGINQIGKIFPVSALTGEGVGELMEKIKSYAVDIGGTFYPQDDLSDRPQRFFVSEFIRKSVITETFQELPHSVFILLEDFKEEENIVHIEAKIVVERQSQKGIVVGKKGSMIKKIGIKSRIAIEEFVGKKVNLQLFVKVVKNWSKDELFLSRHGYRDFLKSAGRKK